MQASQRRHTLPRLPLSEHPGLADLKIESAFIRHGTLAAGRSPIELELRKRTGALLVAVRRGAHLLEDPDPSAPLKPEDVVYLVGSKASVKAAILLLSTAKDVASPGDASGAPE
jgi:K+/H+ antiporter YhaU regulatory subunit KhtT